MPHENFHLSDLDLIMAADGELPVGRRAQMSEHVEACWSCRERMRSIDATISDFVRARNEEVNPAVPPADGPRALLRARLAEASTLNALNAPPRLIWRLAPEAIRPLAPAAGAFFAVLAAIAFIFGTSVSADGPKPKAGLTPGETRPITIEEACRNPQAEVVVADIPAETRQRVFSEYGIDEHSDNFEVDYLITPDLGGIPSMRNLWPQPYTARWNAHVKDLLEQRLHQLVCDRKVELTTAQHDIAADWIGAYKKYLGTALPR